MGRLKVTAKGKVKKNVPITRIGKKQYLKRRFAHVRAVDVAGANNRLTQEYVNTGHHTAQQSFAHLGLRADASASVAALKEQVKSIPRAARRSFAAEEQAIAEAEEVKRSQYVGRPVSEMEGAMLATLLEVYGTDLKRMTYDHKRNPYQLNTRQLQRELANYMRWEKAAFPSQFAEAEAKGWFSVEAVADPRLRRGSHAKVTLAPAAPITNNDDQSHHTSKDEESANAKKGAAVNRRKRAAKKN